jgi:hypothetical protein
MTIIQIRQNLKGKTVKIGPHSKRHSMIFWTSDCQVLTKERNSPVDREEERGVPLKLKIVF